LHPKRSIFLIIFSILLLSLSHAQAQSTPTAQELEQTIHYLIDRVATSGCLFFRNEKQYGAREAAEHLKAKAKYFKKEIQTPEDFIRLAGTKSIVSGDDYFVRTKEGKEMRCADWLTKMLEDYRKKMKETRTKKLSDGLMFMDDPRPKGRGSSTGASVG
jgi:hypothetical protein